MWGIVPVYKPVGVLSSQCVEELKRSINKKVGHAGALDKPAEGLLILCVGKATRLAECIMDLPKLYYAEAMLGLSTDTGDISGTVKDKREFTEEKSIYQRLYEITLSFLGHTLQRPHPLSSVKVKGKRAHDLYRKGKSLLLPPKLIYIQRISLKSGSVERFLDIKVLKFSFEAVCSRGTYIRSLVEDIGKALGYPACLKRLIRKRVGGVSLEDALKYESLSDRSLKLVLEEKKTFCPIRFLSRDYPFYLADKFVIKRLINGVSVSVDALKSESIGSLEWDKRPLITDEQKSVIVVAKPMFKDKKLFLKPTKVVLKDKNEGI